MTWRGAAERAALALGAPLLLVVVLELLFWAFDVAPAQESLSALEYPFDPARVRARVHAQDARPVVLCLGESSMAGYPLDGDHPAPGFSLCDRVAATVGARAVNLAEGGIAMRHVAARAAVACERPLPAGSLVLVYGGHNEFLNLPRVSPQVGAVARTLGRLRLFRWLRDRLGGPSEAAESLSGAGEPLADRAEVLAGFEQAFRDVIHACRGTPTLVATVVGNPAFHVAERPSDDDAIAGGAETLRDYARRRRGATGVDSSTRELLIAPPELNDAIARVAAETSTPLVDTRTLPLGDPLDAFLDWVHPSDSLHQTLAAAFLRGASAAGLWRGALTPPPSRVAPALLAWATEQSAARNVKLDPAFALLQLRRLGSPRDALAVGLARLVAGFIQDAPADLQAGVALLERHLSRPEGRAALGACLGPRGRGAGQSSCLPWRGGALLSDTERAELLAALVGVSPEVRALVGGF